MSDHTFRFGMAAMPDGAPERWVATARRAEALGHPRPTNAVDREHLSALQGAGDGAIEAGEWDEARQHLETALQAAEAEYGRQHLYYAQAQAAYGRLMLTTGAIDAAYANLSQSVTVLRSASPSFHPDLPLALINLAKSCSLEIV